MAWNKLWGHGILNCRSFFVLKQEMAQSQRDKYLGLDATESRKTS